MINILCIYKLHHFPNNRTIPSFVLFSVSDYIVQKTLRRI